VDALSQWHGLELSGVTSSTNRTAKLTVPILPRIQSIASQSWISPPPLDTPTPPPFLPLNSFNDPTVAGQYTMLTGVSPKTRWSAHQDGLFKERLTTPLPRVQMGMYLLSVVIWYSY
jgi:hypothetical protein